MNGKKNTLIAILGVFLIGVIFPAVSLAAEVTTECAYRDVDVVCEIYVDTTPDDLISGGVKLTYNTTPLDPGELSTPVAAKNEAVWYFGDGPPPDNQPYMDPEVTAPGEVVFIVGKLATGAPGAGVSGTRVKVGDVTFTRNDTTLPGVGVDRAAFFGISAGLGRAAPFVNFASTTGTDLDGAGFTTKVAERGDVDGNGLLNSRDFIAIRALIISSAQEFPVYADCDANQIINSRDLICVRAKLLP